MDKDPFHIGDNEDLITVPSLDAGGISVLAEQLAIIAEQLRSSGQSAPGNPEGKVVSIHSASENKAARNGAAPIASQSQRGQHAKLARDIYEIRRKRAAIFGNADLFGEPAWDILLDLYIAHADQKPVSVSSACIGSLAPATTGLRWLGVLTDCGLVKRMHDPEDQRRVLVVLSERGLAAMDRYFETAKRRR